MSRKFFLRGLVLCVGLPLLISGCSTLPTVSHKKYDFPENAYIGVPKNLPRYERLGLVKSKAAFETIDLESDPDERCKNYFNKAVRDLVKLAQKNGADAVIEVQSVTFLMTGKVETYPRAECVDEGDVGEVYVQGTAIRFVKKDQE
jgi:hypothetical protein